MAHDEHLRETNAYFRLRDEHETEDALIIRLHDRTLDEDGLISIVELLMRDLDQGRADVGDLRADIADTTGHATTPRSVWQQLRDDD